MNTRKIVAGIAIATAVVLGTTGCSLNHNVDSLQAYAPSDGVQADLASAKVRNLIYLTQGGFGKLIGTVINTSSNDIAVSFSYGDVTTDPITISAGEKLELGSNPSTPGLEVTMDGKPGDLTELTVFVNSSESVKLLVPVLDGTLDQYAPYFLY